jgi:DNA repair protein RadC
MSEAVVGGLGVVAAAQVLREDGLPFAVPGPSLRPPGLGDAAALASLLRPVLGMGEAMILAERLLGRFGSFAALLAAGPAQLALEPGLPAAVRDLLLAAGPFIEAVLQERLPPQDLARHRRELLAYVAASRCLRAAPELRALLLDGEGALLADLPLVRGADMGAGEAARALLRLVCDHEPRAVATLRIAAHDPAGLPPEELAAVDGIVRMLAHLDVALHDHVVAGPVLLVSARERRLL